MNNKSKIISKIESELLSTLFNYVVPFIDKKIKPSQEKQERKTADLENIINSKQRIGFRDVKELEEILKKEILKNLNNDISVNKNIVINSKNIFYSLNLRRQKNKAEKSDKYSISIKYEENQAEEKLKIEVQKNEKDIYFAEVIDKKDIKDKVTPYSLIISYEDNYAEERLTITYRQQLKNYMQLHIESKEDMSNRVPLKWLNILPETFMGGVLGFTYLGENFMTRRADLTGQTARMVDIHESIHTPDEYETRVLTSWIMESVFNKNEKYSKFVK